MGHTSFRSGSAIRASASSSELTAAGIIFSALTAPDLAATAGARPERTWLFVAVAYRPWERMMERRAARVSAASKERSR